MKDIVQLFKDAIRKNRERGHDTLYVAIDVHGTIFRPSRKTTIRFNKESKEMHRHALWCLKAQQCDIVGD